MIIEYIVLDTMQGFVSHIAEEFGIIYSDLHSDQTDKEETISNVEETIQNILNDKSTYEAFYDYILRETIDAYESDDDIRDALKALFRYKIRGGSFNE